MIRAWLDLPPAGIFLSLATLYFGCTGLLEWTLYDSPLAPRRNAINGVVAPFFTAVAVLFALLTGFLANDVSDRERRAQRSVQSEAGELRNVHTLSVASASDMLSIRRAIKAYVEAVVIREWPAMAQHGTSKADAAYDDLLREVSDPSIAQAAGQAVHAALLGATVRAGTARNERLALVHDHATPLKWAYVLLLGLLTQIAIALVHVGQPWRPSVAALSVFSLATVVALGIIALQESPFDGPFRVSAAPNETLRALPDVVTPPPSAN